jgi:serine/threonine protein kinase
MPLETGEILHNRYRILKILGVGGFGAVYRAADMALKVPCAVKENLDTSPEAQRQFEKEAVILAHLSHPNLPRVLDHFIIPEQGQYLVMDFIDGEDLYAVVTRMGVVPQKQALDWISQIAGALNYLHNQNPPVIHRDIKPANIRIRPDGRAFLVDFGLVKASASHMMTTIGARAVTPGYSPPEQYGHGRTDPRTDIYALAATLYTLLTGLEPQESIQRVVSDNLIPLNSTQLEVRPDLGGVVGKGMHLQPSQRYPTVAAFEQALKNPSTREVVQRTQVASPSFQAVTKAVSDPDLHTREQKKTWLWVVIGIGVIAAFFAIRTLLDNLGFSPPEPTTVAEEILSVRGETAESGKGQINSTPTEPQQPTIMEEPTDTPPPTDAPLPPTNTTAPPTHTPVPADPFFSAGVNMFCRDGPGAEYEAHTTIMAGEVLPVYAQWNNGWFLVGIEDPTTRTKCCWITGDGDLNVNRSSIETINYLVDRITCNPR